MSLLPNPGINKLEPCPHGGINYCELEELAISPNSIIDFSVNSNPFGPPPVVIKALTEVAIDRYPDPEAIELRRALAAKFKLAAGNILVGNGSTEILRFLTLAYLREKDLVIIPQPAFGEYEFACRLVGARLLKPWAQKKENFQIRIADLIPLIKRHPPKAIFLGNPNNPTGQYFSREEIEAIAEAASNSLVILDEAYINFVEESWSSLDLIRKGKLILLRSMTKDYALGGLRLGYVIAEESIISNLRRVRPPWNVNAVAQKAGLLAISEDGYLEECRKRLQGVRSFLIPELTVLGLSPLPSQANFFIVEVGNARQFRQLLLEKGVLVRDCTSFGLPEYIRLALRSLPECQHLIARIKESGVLHQCQPKH